MPNIQNLLKQLREAESKATRGEWKFDKSENFGEVVSQITSDDGYICSNESYQSLCPGVKDMHLIVLMRNNLIPLLDYVEGLEKERTKIATECQKETAKAIFSSIECIKQRYGVSWSGEARINLNKLKKLYNAE